jgi:hypothetical protein
MAEIDTLCFGDADGVTGPPEINGLVDYDFLPFNTLDPNEPGYTNGCRLTYAGGSLASVIFQGVRRTGPDQIVLGFMARFATAFDERDTVLIGLRTAFASSSPTRVILVKPNPSAAGVEAGVGDGAAHIKRNVEPVGLQSDIWELDLGTNIWSQSAMPPGMEIKLRSWEPERTPGAPFEACWSVEIGVPRVSAGGWIDLPDSFGLYFDVIRTVGNSATHSTFPTEAGPPPGDEPGVPGFMIPKFGRGLIPAVQSPPGSNTGLGVRFKNGWMGVGRRDLGSGTTTLTGLINGKLGPPALTDNEIVALLENTSPNPCNDVRAEFRFRNFGLGSQNFEAWAQPPGLYPNPAPHRVSEPIESPVDLAGTPIPTSPTSALIKSTWLRANVPIEYNAHPHQCIQVQLESAGGAAFTQASVRRNMDFTHFSEVEHEIEVGGDGYPEPADGSGEHDFFIQTFCRKINLLELMTAKEIADEARAVVENTLAQANDKGGPFVGGIQLNQDAVGIPPEEIWKNKVVFFWVAQGHRRTGTFIRLQGKEYENLDSSPGEFGVSAYHVGAQDAFHYALSGAGLVQYGPGVYGIKVPHKGKRTIKIRVGAGPDVKPGDRSDLPKETLPPPKPLDGGGNDGLPKGCLAALIGLFGKKKA